MKTCFLFFCIVLQAITVNAQQEDSLLIRRLADEILTRSEAYKNLHHPTKKIGGRLAGSPQMVK
ncbi:MAG TPA: peptidase M28 family protein, partial [Flavisolibacter sp.]|nr:peptidase M28 family protein [Flavisolibacter sp.]